VRESVPTKEGLRLIQILSKFLKFFVRESVPTKEGLRLDARAPCLQLSSGERISSNKRRIATFLKKIKLTGINL